MLGLTCQPLRNAKHSDVAVDVAVVAVQYIVQVSCVCFCHWLFRLPSLESTQLVPEGYSMGPVGVHITIFPCLVGWFFCYSN